jgi:GNAT superfamily N-acetyltransferase
MLSPWRTAAPEPPLSNQNFNGDGEPNEAHHGGWAEMSLDRRGLTGKTFHVPSAYKDIDPSHPDRWALTQRLQRQHSSEAENYVNGVLEKNGWDRGPLTVEPEDWDTREAGAIASYHQGKFQIGLKGNHVNELTLLHETAHALLDTTHENYHGHEFKNVLHDLIHQNLGKEAGDAYGDIGFRDISPNQLALPLFKRERNKVQAASDLVPKNWQTMMLEPPDKTRLPADIRSEDYGIESPASVEKKVTQQKPNPADDALSEWTSVRDNAFGDALPSVYAVPCPTCSGKGCHGCGFIGKVFSNDFQPKEAPVTNTIKPWANKLEKDLYEQFMDWWPTSEASKIRSPETVGTGWSRHPTEPITHWLNVEDFLSELHPEAATGSSLGLEQAKPLLQRTIEDNPMSPEEMEQYGYTGTGNVKTQAMLNLHNKLQGRVWDNAHDQRRYYEFMLRHLGPNARKAVRLARLVASYAASERVASQRFWAMAWDDWKDQIQGGCDNCEPLSGGVGRYRIHHPGGENSFLSFTHERDSDWNPALGIRVLFTNPDYRHDGVAESMMRRLVDDHPDQKIKPGYMLNEGQAFHDKMLEKEPRAKDLVTGRFWRTSMPAPAPKGLQFRPGTPRSRGLGRVDAYVGDDPVGHLEWLDDDNPWSKVTPRRPGEVSHIYVHPNARRQSVATEMFDHVKNNVRPDLHHSERRTNLGDSWVDYEQNRVASQRLFLSMAWDEWKDKIGHDAPGTGMVSNRGWYHVDHEDGAMVPKGYVPRYSDLTYFHHPDKKRIDIDMLAVYPEFQGRGVGEALMRRLHQDYPDHKINPGSMTGEGQGFYEKMLQKEPTARDLVTAANRLLQAMAWQDWAPQIQGGCDNCNHDKLFGGRGEYFIEHEKGDEDFHGFKKSTLDFYHDVDRNGQPQLYIQSIQTNPHYRHDGVAESLMRKLHEEHPDTRINTGIMTDDGEEFYERMLQKEPSARDFTANQILMAMADTTKWHPLIQHENFGGYEGTYHIPDSDYGPSARAGELTYSIYEPGEHFSGSTDPIASIESVIVHPDHQGQGVAQALVERLHKDFPKHKIDPGSVTPQGNGFAQRMMEIVPGAKNKIRPDYEPNVMGETRSEDWANSQYRMLDRQRMMNAAKKFWSAS